MYRGRVTTLNPDAHDAEPTDARVVDERLDEWRQELLELAGGSALWDIDSLGEAIIELTGAHPSGIAQLYAGRRTRLSYVVREGASLSQARRQARVVLSRADDLAGQFGVAPTYVAMGVARWFMADEPRRVRSEIDLAPPEGRMVQVPVLLRPIRMHPLASNDIEMELDPQVEINPVLVRALRLHGVQVDPAILAASTNQEHGFTPRPALDAIQALGGGLPDFELDTRIIVGTFVHPGQALAEDLDEQRDTLRNHHLVRAISGVEDAGEQVRRNLPSQRLLDPDPDTERGVGDLDSAQHQILDAIVSGSDLFIDAPPGVDTASTVAAIIAELAKAGSTALYVPGTRRAGAAVSDAARRVGIHDLVLDVSGDAQWRKTAAERLIDGLNPPTPESDPQVQTDRQQLRIARKTLGDFIGALHLPRDPWGVSANRVLHELADLTSQRPGPRTQVRLPSTAVTSLSQLEQDQARATLIEAADLGAFRLRASDTPWYGAQLQDAEHATTSMEQVQRLAQSLPAVKEQIAATAAQTGLDEATTLGEWEEQLDLLAGISTSLDRFTSEAFERPADDMVAATASKKWRTENNQVLPGSTVRRLKKQARDLVRPGVVVPNLHEALDEVAQQREIWRKHCSGGGWPRVPENLNEISTTFAHVGKDVTALEPALALSPAGKGLRDLPLAELQTKMERLAQDEHNVHIIPKRVQALAKLKEWGLGELADDLSHRRVHTDLVGPEFDLAWWSSVLEEMLTVDPAMVALDPQLLEEGLANLRSRDLAHVQSLLNPVLAAHGHHMREAIANNRTQAQEFYRGVKQRGELDLRTLMQDYPDIVWRPRPTWIVPPMVIPQALPPNVSADVVILDAVHGLGVEYLLPAIARGKQVVVIADSRRKGSPTLESLSVLPRITLPADRVDRAAPLAQFLTDHGYGEAIQPVPSPPQFESGVVAFDLVDGVGMPAPDSDVVESLQTEVDRVVDLALDHALTNPGQTLAVVTLNSRHADRVREAVAEVVDRSPAVAEFFDPQADEAFTVVSADAAAGLRRDAIILTVGFGKTPHGRVLHRFGPISGPHGEGFLTDAIGASRHHLTVVSSFSVSELDPGRLRSEGSTLLYHLLQFAEAGDLDPQEGTENENQPDRLLVDLAERLWRLGITVLPQYGQPGWFRIPLALGHPSRPDELLMALLTDDTAYTTETSLRRRDRHWPERLEQRGWNVRTVYSTAVFMDPQGEAERIAEEVTAIAHELSGTTPEPQPELPEVVLDGSEDVLTEHESAAPAPVRVSARSETIAGQTNTSIPVVPTPGERPDRPEVPAGRPISGYSDDELDSLVNWLGSDAQPRTEEQYVIELRQELGLTRKSTHVDTVLSAAVRRNDVPMQENKKPRRATRVGTEDPEFSESSWRVEEPQEPGNDDDDRILREKPPHW